MTALQPLTDIQVTNRLDAYNAGGKLERDIRALWEDAGDLIEAEVRDQFGDEAAATVRNRYTMRVDAAWIQAVAESGRRIYQEKISVPAYIAERDKLVGRVIGRLFERFAAEIKSGLMQADFATKRTILTLLIKRIEVGEEDLKIVYKVQPPPFAHSPNRGGLHHRLSFVGRLDPLVCRQSELRVCRG